MDNNTEPVKSLTVIDIKNIIDAEQQPYRNLPLGLINDHVVRLSVMTTPFYWHLHPNSDESFLVLEGSLIIEMKDTTVELLPQQLFTIPANTPHCTRPGGNRSVNLTIEKQAIQTVRVDTR